MRVVDDFGNELPRGKLGNLVAKLPLPLGTFLTLWQDDERFVNTYFTKYEVLFKKCRFLQCSSKVIIDFQPYDDVCLSLRNEATA